MGLELQRPAFLGPHQMRLDPHQTRFNTDDAALDGLSGVCVVRDGLHQYRREQDLDALDDLLDLHQRLGDRSYIYGMMAVASEVSISQIAVDTA